MAWDIPMQVSLLAYLFLALVTTGIRVAFPRDRFEATFRDGANILFLVVLLVGALLVLLVHLRGMSEDPAGIALGVACFAWLITFQGREHLVTRKRFWLFWSVGILVTPIAGIWGLATGSLEHAALPLIGSGALLGFGTMTCLPRKANGGDEDDGDGDGGDGGE